MNANVASPSRVNEFGQPIGFALPHWKAPPFPPHVALTGRYCRLEPLDSAKHAHDMYEAQCEDAAGSRWTYMFHGPFADFAAFEKYVGVMTRRPDPQAYAIVDPKTGRAVGTASYLRIVPEHGVLEVGHIYYSPRLARSRAASEAMYLMMRNAFALGYRRYEWKCDSCNAPSRAAAERLGFIFEGIFRQAIVLKGRNRDTAWYAIIDRDWPRLRAAFEAWLDPANFDAAGRQIAKLSELTAHANSGS